jgi:RNase H-fold protein (predicted Holliday junction resolvase)
LAQPLTTVPTAKIFPELIKLIDQHKIDQLIVGLPDGLLKSFVDDFVTDLLDLGYTVVTWPETLSSHDARQSLLHKSKSGRKSGEHAAAAAIILQSWLDSKPN